eukprot:2430006-Ditylum_brightwellii.AAC.1
MDNIFQNQDMNAQVSRDLLVRILDALVGKFDTLRGVMDDIVQREKEWSLLDASADVSTWLIKVPTEQSSVGTMLGVTMEQFCIELSIMLTTIEGAMKFASSDQINLLGEEKKRIDLCTSTMKCLEAALQSEKGDDIYLLPPFLEAMSPAHLFQILIAQGVFILAERLIYSE